MNNSDNSFESFVKEYTKKDLSAISKEEICSPKSYRLENGMDITLRLEDEKDYFEVEALTREAFWDESNFERLEGVGANEHYLVHLFHNAPEYVKELDFIAEYNGEIVGNVIYCISYVLEPSRNRYPTLIFGPLSVLPKYKKLGIGSVLMRHSLKVAARLGYGSVFCYGHPEYYPRFGFKEAKNFNITTADGQNYPAFMAMELIYGEFDGISGFFHYPPLYDADPKDNLEFDREFVKKLADWRGSAES